MKIYMLTKLGERAASSTTGGDSEAWQALYYLKRVGRATGDDLREAGASSAAIARLRRTQLIAEISEEDY